MQRFGTHGLARREAIGLALARHTFFGRGRGRQLIEKFFFEPREKPRDGLIWNGTVKLRIPPKSSLKYMISDKRYDELERNYLRRAIRKGDVVIDIGANIGFYTLWIAALRVPGTKVVSIEANPSVYQALVENVQVNEFDNVETVNAAIGEKDGTTSFGVWPDQPSTGSVLAKGAEQIHVPMRTLSSLLDELGIEKCDIIKIDVEGYEDQALLPFLDKVSPEKWPRLFIIEHKHHQSYQDRNPMDVLAQNGYHAVLKTRGNVVFEKSSLPVGDGVNGVGSL